MHLSTTEHAALIRPSTRIADALAVQALAAVDAAVSIVDLQAPDQPLVFVNEAFCQLTGYTADEVLGRNCRFLQHPDTDPAAVAAVRDAVGRGQAVRTVLRNRRRDGSAFWNALQLVPLAQPGGPVTHFVGFQHDLTDWSLSAHAVLAMEAHPAGPARQRFDVAVADAVRDQSAGRQRQVLMLLRAVDGPDGQSDPDAAQHGPDAPQAGPAPMPLSQRVAVTAQLRPLLASTASLYFLADHQVAALVPLPDGQTPGAVAERVLALLQAVWPCRAGLAELVVDGNDAASLLGVARQAGGRTSDTEALCFADAARDASDQRLRLLLRDLRGALAAQQFRLVFQPIVLLATGEVTGFEALLRWSHPTLGEVMPGEFIAQLEQLPVIGDVSCWVVQTALAQLARWDTELGRPLRMSVNVPAEVLKDDHFAAHVLAELARHQLSPRQLELELTERSLASADGPVVARLRELRRHGVMVAIDDFGTGWSGLSYLAQLPVDTLKVDLRFTQGVTHDQTDAAISRMTVELARGLGLRCVAEGIERAGQHRFFADLRCHEGQGYLFARPLEVDAVCQLLATALRLTPPDEAAVAASARERHLLILDDEENVLRALRRTLRPAGFHIHITTSPDEAFEVLALHPVGVVMADQRMPEMTGSEFLRRVKDRYPQTRRIVLSGYTDLQSITDAINQGAIYKFLTKPWNDAELLALLETAFAEFELGAENRRLQQALQHANRRLEETLQAQGLRMSHGETALDVMHAAIAAVAVPVLGLDPAGDLVMINEAAEALFWPALAPLGEPIAPLLGYEPALDVGGPPRRVALGRGHYQVHCTPMHTGTSVLGLVLTLLEAAP